MQLRSNNIGKIDILNIDTGGCGGPQRTDFIQFLLGAGVVVLEELILNSRYFGSVWWS